MTSIPQPFRNSLLSAAPAAPQPQPLYPNGSRSFGDAAATRKQIFDNVLKATQTLPVLENRRHILGLENVRYVGPERFSIKDHKQAMLDGRTLARRLRGAWILRDKNSGQEIDRREATIANVPYMTDGGTFVHNGSEYAVANQLRLLPGSYTRRRDTGEIESHINLLPGKGRSHRYFLDPEKQVFYARIAQAKIPLISLLRVMGVTDNQLRDAWGDGMAAANMKLYSDVDADKFYQRMAGRQTGAGELTKAERYAALKSAVEAMELDPNVALRTLGKPHKTLSLDAILDSTKKLLSVYRDEAEGDDRDNLAYQRLFGPEDLFAERIAKDYGGIRRKLFNQTSWSGNLSRMKPGALTRQIEGVLLGSGLAQSLEGINPVEILDVRHKVTRMGEGGIGSSDSIPDESRVVAPSHLNYIDLIRTPESAKVGIDLYMSSSARKGQDGRLYSPFTDAKSGKTVWKSPQDIVDSSIVFPRELDRNTKRVFAMQGGRLRIVPKEKVDLILPHFENTFSPIGNLVPFKSMMKGQRMAMGGRFLTQSLPLQNPEAPLVQSGMPGGKKSYDAEYGRYVGALRSEGTGRVVRVSPDEIRIRYESGKEQSYDLHNNTPYNRKTSFSQTPVVQEGQLVTRDQLLSRSNFTDKNGTIALGKNARVAFLPFRGLNYEDAVVISKSFADRLSSEHLYQHKAEFNSDFKKTRGDYLSIFPGKYDRRQLDVIDETGTIKPGSEVHYGDPLILAASPQQAEKGRILKRRSKSFSDASVTWQHHSPGIVTDISRTDNGTTVLVKSWAETQLADKLSGRYGNKGVISQIVPDEDMPRDSQGRPFEVLFNPLGVISRGNPGQLAETALGKIAEKTGKPYIVPDFEDSRDMSEWVLDELRKHDMSDTEDVIDPETGRKIPGVFTGSMYILKLAHQAEAKGQGRATGGYTAEDLPSKQGPEPGSGSKRLAMMNTYALMSHGATGILRDASEVRGQRNEDFWLAYMQGYSPRATKVPFIYKKFVEELRAAGVNVVQDGPKTHIMALTDKDIDDLAGDREIRNGETVDFSKGLEPVKGGLFDPSLTGGRRGNRWSKITLAEPILSPVMEEPTRRLLGLTQKKFDDIVAGKEQFNGETGMEAIRRGLENINLVRDIAKARMEIKGTRKTVRDAAVRKIGYLKAAQRLGVHPKDWVISKVPVLPPIFRPVSVMSGSGTPLVADANYLYHELLDANDLLKTLKKDVDDVGLERLGLYNAAKAVVGLGDPVHPKLQEKRVGGILQKIFGSSPKYGIVQQKLLSTPVDLVGRAVIVPNPDLDVDHIGLPEEKAWSVYRNFIVRRLRRRGLPVTEALRQTQDRTRTAKEAMLQEMAERPVYVDRAPVLHRLGILAFWPKLVKGNALQVSPTITTGFNADFDGDMMNYHVPVSDDAVDEAVNLMMPSKNLISPADFRTAAFMPTQEYLGGLFAATSASKKKGTPRYFPDAKAAIAAYFRGDIPVGAQVRIGS